jgi:hypothetical protein
MFNMTLPLTVFFSSSALFSYLNADTPIRTIIATTNTFILFNLIISFLYTISKTDNFIIHLNGNDSFSEYRCELILEINLLRLSSNFSFSF